MCVCCVCRYVHVCTGRVWGGEEGVYIPAFCTRMVHVGKLTGHNAGVSSLAVLNNLLITGSRDRLIKVWLWAWGTCVL